MSLHQERQRLTNTWAGSIWKAAHGGAFSGGEPLPIQEIQCVCGPRAGAIEVLAGFHVQKLYRSLSAANAALARQFVPWDFVGDVAVFMAGRYLRVEAGWPDDLAETMIRLTDLGQRPKNGGRWLTGKNELGATVTMGFSDRTPHFLLAGTTGSGKSVATRSAVLQLARDPENQLVLVDGKFGEGLGKLARLKGVVGPVAVDAPTVRSALSWAVQAMRRRYAGGHEGRVIVVIDEIQEISRDEACQEMVRRLVAQGRAAGVHVLAATQHPVIDSFGGDSTVKRNLVGRIALKTMDAKSSEVAVGAALPRADHLLGSGDSYCIAPQACHRVQLAYVDERDLEGALQGEYLVEEWDDFAAEDLGQNLPEGYDNFLPGEIAISILAGQQRIGRPTLCKTLEHFGYSRPGAERGMRLLALGQAISHWLNAHGFAVCLSGKATYTPKTVQTG